MFSPKNSVQGHERRYSIIIGSGKERLLGLAVRMGRVDHECWFIEGIRVVDVLTVE